jgi:hypothetical protein
VLNRVLEARVGIAGFAQTIDLQAQVSPGRPSIPHDLPHPIREAARTGAMPADAISPKVCIHCRVRELFGGICRLLRESPEGITPVTGSWAP